jgi:pimeloyl-ACP methyl ester carboxylesterase
MLGMGCSSPWVREASEQVRGVTAPFHWRQMSLSLTEENGAADPREAYERALGPRWERVQCKDVELRADALASGRVLVAVHGMGGDGAEWSELLPALARLHPSAAFMFQWKPHVERRELVRALSRGLERIAACSRGHAEEIWVIAHSAGGVLASRAAGELRIQDDEPRVRLWTIASPLAGTGMRAEPGSFDGSDRFAVELGGLMGAYRPAGPRVTVVHLRTRAPADSVMKPGTGGHLPNDPAVGVPSAPQVDLPETLTHDGSLRWVVERLLEGERWERTGHLPKTVL